MKKLEELKEMFKSENEEVAFDYLDEFRNFSEFESSLDYETKHSDWYYTNKYYIEDFYDFKNEASKIFIDPELDDPDW